MATLAAVRSVTGSTSASVTELRNTWSPMLVMPSAVLDVPKTTIFEACAIGSAAWAEFESVGPNSISALSWKMSFLKALIASSFLPCSSSITSSILLPLTPPAALISSAAIWKPLRMLMPYCAAPPDRASATPILMGPAAWAEPSETAAASAMAEIRAKRGRSVTCFVSMRGRSDGLKCKRWRHSHRVSGIAH